LKAYAKMFFHMNQNELFELLQSENFIIALKIGHACKYMHVTCMFRNMHVNMHVYMHVKHACKNMHIYMHVLHACKTCMFLHAHLHACKHACFTCM
jgi:hypothetical protein